MEDNKRSAEIDSIDTFSSMYNYDLPNVNIVNGKFEKTKKNTLYKNVIDKSLNVKPVRVKKQNKKMKMSNFKKIIYTLLISSSILNVIGIKMLRKKNTFDIVNTSYIMDTFDYDKIDDEYLYKQMEIVYEKLHENGFSNDVIMYYVREVFGEKAFNSMARFLGFNNGDNFVINEGYKYDVMTNSTGTMEWAKPSHIKFNIDMYDKLSDTIESKVRKGK